jgi:hypothetical protein
MFLRHKLPRKDGKEHRYWGVVGKLSGIRRPNGAAACALLADSLLFESLEESLSRNSIRVV